MNDKVAESDPLTPGQKWGVVKIFGSLLLGALAIFGTAGYFLITTTSERVAQAAVNSSVFRELVVRDLKDDTEFDQHLEELAKQQFLGVSDIYTWSSGEQPVKLIDESEGLCFLTAAKGKFEGFKQQVYVALSEGSWILSGQSDQKPGVGGEARCLLYRD